MRQLSIKKNTYELQIETLEDMWILSQIIDENDEIYSKTSRKIKIDNKKTITKIIYLELIVKKCIFDTNNLRIQGIVKNENEYVAQGQSHSLNFSIKDIINFKKEHFLKYKKKLLTHSIKSKKDKNLLILFDRDELICAEITDFNYSILFSKNNLGSKKYLNQNIDENEQKYKLIENYLNRDYSNIILSAPGMVLNSFSKFLKTKTKKKIIDIIFSEITSWAIPKIIKKLKTEEILKESSFKMEAEVIEIFLKCLKGKKLTTYGYKEVQDTINQGNIEILLVTTKFIQQQKELNNFQQLNNLFLAVENLSANLIIINSKYENGKIIDGFTGISAILKY